MRCEPRTLDDIRALGGNDLEDERRFATAARLSEINLALYRAFAQPCGQGDGDPADGARRCGACIRCGSNTSLFGPRIPSWPGSKAPPSRSARTGSQAAADNPFLAMQERRCREQIVEGLETWRQIRRKAGRGNVPRDLRLALCCRRRSASTPNSDEPPRKAAKNLLHRATDRHAHRRAEGATCAKADCARPASGRCSMSAWREVASTSAASRRSAGCGAADAWHRKTAIGEFKRMVREQYLHAADRRGGSTCGDSGPAARGA